MPQGRQRWAHHARLSRTRLPTASQSRLPTLAPTLALTPSAKKLNSEQTVAAEAAAAAKAAWKGLGFSGLRVLVRVSTG